MGAGRASRTTRERRVVGLDAESSIGRWKCFPIDDIGASGPF